MSYKTRLVEATVKVMVELGTDGEWPGEDEFRRWVAQNSMEALQRHDWTDPLDVAEFAELHLDSYDVVEEGESDA